MPVPTAVPDEGCKTPSKWVTDRALDEMGLPEARLVPLGGEHAGSGLAQANLRGSLPLRTAVMRIWDANGDAVCPFRRQEAGRLIRSTRPGIEELHCPFRAHTSTHSAILAR